MGKNTSRLVSPSYMEGPIDTQQRTSIQRGILFLIAIGIAIILVYLFYPKEKMQETISDPLPIIFETLWHWIT